MDQNRAPLYEALRERRLKGESSFHVPGHKFGAGLGIEGDRHFGSIMEIDYTEIDGLDDLHHPEGPILEAQRLAAACFGAEESHFLIGGSTVGNLAVLTSVCARHDVLLVQRNVHKSVIHGLMLAGAQAVFMQPEVDHATGIAGCVSLHTLEAALRQYPHAKGVFLTNPNYYGMGRELGAYAEAVHRYGMPLLVDEAHGAHFGFHPKVPDSALSQGADVVIQSTHKMLTAMTMGAMLHVQGELVDRRLLKERLAMLQSSSPSYPLMASLDLARRNVAVKGQMFLEQSLQRLRRLSEACQAKEPSDLKLLVPEEGALAYDYIDPFKLVFCDSSGRLSGFELAERLASYKVITEMADDRHVVLACSLATSDEDLSRLELALQAIREGIGAIPEAGPCQAEAGLQKLEDSARISLPLSMELPGERAVEAVDLMEAVGRRSAQSVIPYPPGIPLLFPGEVIRASVVEQIRKLSGAGARFQGAEQVGPACSILVMKER
jgi:arginine decarboxylase